MDINDKCIFHGTKGDKECIILDKKIELGSSIKNDALQSMDLKLTTYYKINYYDKYIWVSEGFLSKCI